MPLEMQLEGTIIHLNQNILVDFSIGTPDNIEQNKIGDFYKRIDQTITLHQREPCNRKENYFDYKD